MTLVLDASMVLSWIFKDERDANSRAGAAAVLDQGAIVPTIWQWEVQNALLSAERGKRISADEVVSVLHHLASLPIEIDSIGPAVALGTEIEMARRMNLSVYDAAYVDLALRRGLKVMTRDGKLAAAADALHIRWTR